MGDTSKSRIALKKCSNNNDDCTPLTCVVAVRVVVLAAVVLRRVAVAVRVAVALGARRAAEGDQQAEDLKPDVEVPTPANNVNDYFWLDHLHQYWPGQVHRLHIDRLALVERSCKPEIFVGQPEASHR